MTAQFTIKGHPVKPAEVGTYGEEARPIARVTLASNRRGGVDYFDVAVFDESEIAKLREASTRHTVEVRGFINQNTWVNGDGDKQSGYNFIATTVTVEAPTATADVAAEHSQRQQAGMAAGR